MASKNSTKKQQAQTTRNTASIAKATGIDLSKTLNALTSSGVQIQGTLSKISEELIQKHSELQAVDEAIALKKAEMEALHGVDNVLLNIDEAKALHQQHLDEMSKQKDELEAQHQDLQNQLAQERQREEEEYAYKLAQQRKADSDAWVEQVRLRGNQERDRKEAFEKDLTNREFILKTKEVEYQAALEKAKNYDADVSKEVAKAEAILKNVLTKDFNHEKQITAVQHTALYDKQVHDNKRLVDALNTFEIQVKELQVQLKAAYEENAKLARAAVDGAANSKAQSEALALMTNLGSGNGARPRS